MFGRFLLLLLILGSLLAAWQTGVLESIRSGGNPEYGREATVEGPVRIKGVAGAANPEALAREIDTHVGGVSSERLAAAMGLQPLFDSGELVMIPEHCRVKVIEIGSLTLQSTLYKTVKVRVLEGKLKDSELWVERVNLVDTPLQACFQFLRRQQNSSQTPATREPSGAQE